MTKATTKLNREWHMAHPMPKNPTLQQRIDWHLEHFKHCNCRRDIPPKLKAEMKKLKIKIPEYGIGA
jgi:hypothetical protein